MKIVVRKHKKDNWVTNIWKFYASWKFRKFFGWIKTMFKGSKIDEKVTSLKVKAYINIFA